MRPDDLAAEVIKHLMAQVPSVDPVLVRGPGFAMTPVWEKRIATLLIGRISRITAIELDGRVTPAVEFVGPGPEPRQTAEQMEKTKSLYLENWIKQLP